MAEAIKEYMEMLNEESMNREERKQKQISFRNMKNKRIHSKKVADKTSSNKFQTRTVISSSKSKCPEDLKEKKQED